MKGKRVVLVTHPQPHVLRSMRTLLAQRLLQAPDLFLLGVYHADERESYASARAALRKAATDGPQQIGLHRLTCKIGADEVYGPNGCSETFRGLVQRTVGVVFTGGPDIPPGMYGAKTRLTTVIRAPRRHRWEISWLFHLVGGSRGHQAAPLLADHPKYAVFAICLGMQSLNVATGGTLIQDIPSEVYGLSTWEQVVQQPAASQHRNPRYFLEPTDGVSPFVMHPIRLLPDPLWDRELDWKPAAAAADTRQVSVPSAHHQAVDKLGAGLAVIATSYDGAVIEAVRHTRYPRVLGIQFHPEYAFVWEPQIEARLHEGHPERNYFTAALERDPDSRAFHRKLWALLGRWVKDPEAR